jgi:hypothetical protein
MPLVRAPADHTAQLLTTYHHARTASHDTTALAAINAPSYFLETSRTNRPAASSDIRSNTKTCSSPLRDRLPSEVAKPARSAEPGPGRCPPATAQARQRQEHPAIHHDRPEILVGARTTLEHGIEHQLIRLCHF